MASCRHKKRASFRATAKRSPLFFAQILYDGIMDGENKSVKIVLDVPYCSQHFDVADENWRSRACGIACLKMVMDFHSERAKRKIPSVDELIKENEFINGFGSFGSEHESLVMIVRNCGLRAYRQEFKSAANDFVNKTVIKSPFENELAEEGILKKIRKLEAGLPVIVSAVKNFSEEDKFHLVVLTGFQRTGGELSGFYYHDPDSFDGEKGKHKFVPADTFRKHWRKMAIFVSAG